jgi:hypothetical protein
MQAVRACGTQRQWQVHPPKGVGQSRGSHSRYDACSMPRSAGLLTAPDGLLIANVKEEYVHEEQACSLSRR